MQLFYSILGSFMCGTCFLVVATPNPIHSILLLIRVFFRGTILLFCLQMEYYARLFLIVYVGAIVVLFLFIIRRLELKRVNITTSLTDLFSFRHIILFGLFRQILFFITSIFFDLSQFVSLITDKSAYLVEANQYRDWSKLISRPDQLRALGAILYTEYKVTIILASLLLFLSRVGALAVTLFFPKNQFSLDEINSRKLQDVNNQVMRHPAFTIKF
jgi:NADH-quinone oxidoreductase subunit J